MMRIVLAFALVSAAAFILVFSTFAQEPEPQQSKQVNYDLTSKLEEAYIPYDYPIGKGDRLKIVVNADKLSEYVPMVGKDGTVILPLLGSTRLEGMTVGEASSYLTTRFLEYYREVYVDVAVSMPAKIKVFIKGDFANPGVYIVYSHTTVFGLIQAVGLSSSGYRRNLLHIRQSPIEISREAHMYSNQDGERVMTNIDPLSISVKGEISRDFLLADGDVIDVLKPAKVVKISGTLRPGVYEVLGGEKLSDILSVSGSLDVYMDLENALIERRGPGGKLERIITDLIPASNGMPAPDFELENGDEIKILPRVSRVFVIGSVLTPGAFAYSPNLTALDYLALAGPTDQAHLPNTVLIRQPRDPRRPLEKNDIIHLDIKRITKGGELPEEYTVHPGDVILVPDKGSRVEWRDVISMLSTLFLGIRALE